MDEASKTTAGTRFKAFFCRICPLCIVARRRPDGGFARKMQPMMQHCTFCRARERLERAKAAGTRRG